MAGVPPASSLDPQNATAFQATLTDPDAPAATRFEDVNLDGDEALTVRHTTAIAPYDETFPADTFRGISTNQFYIGSSSERNVRSLTYQSRLGSATSAFLILPLLEESRKTATTAAATGNTTEHVRLVDVRPTGTRGFQLIGSRTTALQLPSTGMRTMVGESYGVRYFVDRNIQDYIGDTVLTVDFARRTVTGRVEIAQFLGSTPARPVLTVDIIAEIASDGSLTGRVTVRGDRVFETGYLTGSLYGATADEIGIAITSSGESGSILGGLVAGQE